MQQQEQKSNIYTNYDYYVHTSFGTYTGGQPFRSISRSPE